MNKIVEKIKRTSITHKEVVCNFFLPIGKLSGNSTTRKEFLKNGNIKIVKTTYGTMEIRNRLLTENDQKLVNAIFHYGDIRILEDGNIASYFSTKEILEELKMGNNYTALKKNIKKIGDAQYYISIGKYTKRVSIFKEHMIEETAEQGRQVVVFDKEYIRMHESDFSIDYRKIFTKISNIPFATIPSIIKYLMVKSKTSKTKIFYLIDVLQDMNFPVDSPSSFREIKHNMKNYTFSLEKDFGIIYDEVKKTLIYNGIKGVAYVERDSSTLELLKQYIGKNIKFETNIYKILNIEESIERNNEWIVTTSKREIILSYFLDDLLFLLSKITQ